MKKVIAIFSFLCFTGIIACGQTINGTKTNPAGSWKFEAPYAPEGYTSGTFTLSLKEDKYNAEMAFKGIDYNFKAENVKVANDSLTFSVIIDGQFVNLSLKVEGQAKMSGKAVYSEGTVLLTMDRSEEEKIR